MYRTILSLQENLRNTRDELHRTKAELLQAREDIAALTHQQSTQKGEDSNPYLTFPILDTFMHASGGTVRHIGMCGAYGKAISELALPNDRPFFSVINIEALPCGWVLCGVISNTAAKSPYSNDRTFYGWHSNDYVYRVGRPVQGYDGWEGWKSGDEGVVRYSPAEQSLKVFHRRLNRVFGIYVLPSTPTPLYLSVLIHSPGSCVRVRAASEDEEQVSTWY
jgi:hypothetical protein